MRMIMRGIGMRMISGYPVTGMRMIKHRRIRNENDKAERE
jgi:hypothetical protein